MNKKDVIGKDHTKIQRLDSIKFNRPLQNFKKTGALRKKTMSKIEKTQLFTEVGTELSQLGFDCPKEVVDIIVGLRMEVNEYKRLLDVERNKSICDGMTGLFNKRHLMEEGLPKAISYAARHKEPLSLIMIDVDNLKKINDSYGHLVGDKVIIRVAQGIKQCMRESDIVARYGGDEFCVICPKTDIEGVQKAQERLQQLVSNQKFKDKDLDLEITISAGASTKNEITLDTSDKGVLTEIAHSLIKEADDNLYKQKAIKKGKNI